MIGFQFVMLLYIETQGGMGVLILVRIFLMFLLPAYLTMRAITTNSPEDDLSWLRFWVIMSMFYMIEKPLDSLNLQWFYPLVKLMLVSWFLLPTGLSGSEILFRLVTIT